MVSLIDLPEEILIFIIRQLDIKSAYNLYKVCRTTKNIILMKGVIKVCNLSLSTLATPKSLQLQLIKGISPHLHELNMCGVSNLSISSLLPAIRRMKCLKTLDVSDTKIKLSDMLDVYKNCTTLENITINFSNDLTIRNSTLSKYQEIFTNFVNVHFVFNNGLSDLALRILNKSSLNMLKFTLRLLGRGLFMFKENDTMCVFKHFCIFIVDNVRDGMHQETLKDLLPSHILENNEYIIIKYNYTYSICASSLFDKFFTENFKNTSIANIDLDGILSSTVAVFLWDKKTIFDELFFFNLKRRIKEILACEIKVRSEQSLELDLDSYDMFSIFEKNPREIASSCSRRPDTEPCLKRKRIAPEERVLNYDETFSKNKNIKLNIYMWYITPGIVTLSPNSEYLRRLTYLSLEGFLVRYSNEFFNVLFRCCEKLITLNVGESSLSSCCASIIRSIPLSQSLKNIRLRDKRIDFQMLFSSFSQCKTLENICITDSSTEYNEIGNVELMYQCANLYNVHIVAETKVCTRNKMSSIFKTLLQKHSEHYIHFFLSSSSLTFPQVFNPYLFVFNLKPIKPV